METKNYNSRDKVERSVEDTLVFFFVMVGVIVITLGLLKLVDFWPEEPQASVTELDNEARQGSENITQTVLDTDVVIQEGDQYPVSIFIDALDREVSVLNPDSSDVDVMDNALLSGVVRHPDSADLVSMGTVFLLGHSSYLPNVQNDNFQAFNGIQKLEWGDTIRLRTESTEYIYSVDKIYEAKASVEEVPLQFEDAKLVLATCNSFGSKDDRFIVEATLVAKRQL